VSKDLENCGLLDELTIKMPRKWLVLAVLAGGGAWAQGPPPVYTADGIVNASDYSSGPFAPNSVLSIFGSNLSWYTMAWSGGTLTSNLGGTSVYVDNKPASVLYVSPSQVNFIVPDSEPPGSAMVYLDRETATAGDVTISMANAAPALFDTGTGFAIATHADGTLLTGASPAQPGEIIVVYATGLGPATPNLAPDEIPEAAASIEWLSTLTVALNGTALPTDLIQYAGLTPGCVGLYQINLQLPPDVAPNPTIQVTVATQSSSGTLAIAVQ